MIDEGPMGGGGVLETENHKLKRPKPHVSTNEMKRNFNKCFLFDFSKLVFGVRVLEAI